MNELYSVGFMLIGGISLLVAVLTGAAGLRVLSYARDKKWTGSWPMLLAVGTGLGLVSSIGFQVVSVIQSSGPALNLLMIAVDLAGSALMIAALASIQLPKEVDPWASR